MWQLALPVALVNPLTVTAAYTTFVAHGRLPSRDLMARLRRRAFRSGPGVRAATVAIAASGHSARGFARRPVAFDGPVAVVWGARDALVPRRTSPRCAARCRRRTSRCGTAWATTPSASARSRSPGSSSATRAAGRAAGASAPTPHDLPEWPPGTVAVLSTAGRAPHAIPVSTAVRAGPRRVLLALARTRTSLARLREDPACALTVLAARDLAFTAYGRATVDRRTRWTSPRPSSRSRSTSTRSRTTPTRASRSRAASRWRWTDPDAAERDAVIHEALRRLAG